jgi:hypothetical protein
MSFKQLSCALLLASASLTLVKPSDSIPHRGFKDDVTQAAELVSCAAQDAARKAMLTPARIAFARTVVKAVGSLGGKVLGYHLRSSVYNPGVETPTQLGASTLLNNSIPDVVAALAAFGFDSLVERLVSQDGAQLDSAATSDQEAVALTLAGAGVEALNGLTEFEFEGAGNSKNGFSFAKKKLANKAQWVLIGTLLRAIKVGVHRKLLDGRSAAMPIFTQLEKIVQFIDLDAVEFQDFYTKGYLGQKKLFTGSVCKVIAALVDGRFAKTAKYNDLAKSLAAAAAAPLVAPLVNAAHATVTKALSVEGSENSGSDVGK